MATENFEFDCPYLGIPDAFAIYQEKLDAKGNIDKRKGNPYWIGSSKYFSTVAPQDVCPDLPEFCRKGGRIIGEDRAGVEREMAKVASIWKQIRALSSKFKGNFVAAADQHFREVAPKVKILRDLTGAHSDAYGAFRLAEARAMVDQGTHSPTEDENLAAARKVLNDAEDAKNKFEAELNEAHPQHRRVYDELMAIAKKQAGVQL
jgi:hypothetical protein